MKDFDVNTATLQEACDYAVFKIVEQGKRCLGGRGRCIYGDGQGNHCGVGWLLDADDTFLMKATLSIESMLRVDDAYFNTLPALVTNHVNTMSLLQLFHDKRDKIERSKVQCRLKQVGIDTTAPQYQQWIDMGK